MYVDSKTRSNPLRRRLRRLLIGERLEEARYFIRRYYRESRLDEEAGQRREAEVVRTLRKTGHYDHTPEELAFGARVAWRNHSRCIGRLFWQSLDVVDCRHISEPDAMAARMIDHMVSALDDGRIRSVISVFAPVRNDVLPPYIENAQIIRYAGYPQPDGSVIGDRMNIENTRIAMALGWQAPQAPGMFDVLPLVICDKDDRKLLYEIPAYAVREVEITHPDHAGIDEMGLRWYAVPCVSNMIMTIGGIEYPCAPFNGFYMATEIASRDYTDENRYDLLADVARAIGEDPDAPGTPFWKDRAMLELNRAVLHSFDLAEVTMVDHHAASAQYMEFARREHAAGRSPPGDWSWIVPPQSSSACPVFHLPMVDRPAVPNFYRSRAVDGHRLQTDYSQELHNRFRQRCYRLRRRYWNWRRQRG